MKLGRNIGSVTIPKRPGSVGGLLGWARAVNKTLQELRDRKVAFTPSKGGGGSSPQRLQFEVYTRGDDLVAAPGNFDFTAIPEVVETDALSGEWYLNAAITFNTTTGAISARSVAWGASPASGDEEITLAYVSHEEGEPAVIEQYNYGPLATLVGGDLADTFLAIII